MDRLSSVLSWAALCKTSSSIIHGVTAAANKLSQQNEIFPGVNIPRYCLSHTSVNSNKAGTQYGWCKTMFQSRSLSAQDYNNYKCSVVHQLITNITYCNQALHVRHCVAEIVQLLLCRQQIGAVLPIDEKLLLVSDEAVSNGVYRLFSGRHFQIF